MVVQEGVDVPSLDKDVSVPGHQMCALRRRDHLQLQNRQEMTRDCCYDR